VLELGLATVRRVAPRLRFNRAKLQADLETLQAVITHRYAVLTSYARSLKQAYATEVARQRERMRRGELTPGMPSFRRLRQWFLVDEDALAETDRARLAATLEQSTALKTFYTMRRDWRLFGNVLPIRARSFFRVCRTGAIAPTRAT
jgi:stearoyl-CoA desaturase (delta-9 desaturase)